MTGPGMDQALDWLREGGLPTDPRMTPPGETEALNALAREFAAAARAYPVVFQKILEMSLFRPPVDHRLDGDAYYRFAQNREGQNQLASAILAYVDHARNLERKDHERQSIADTDTGPGADWNAGASASPFVAVR